MVIEKIKSSNSRMENEKNEEIKIIEREEKLLAQYRNLCEENKVTIEILIQRLLGQEKGRE